VGLRKRLILSPPGFDPRTILSVASRYTDYAIPPGFDPRNVLLVASRYTDYAIPPGFDPRTVLLVASRYTDYAIPPGFDLRTVLLVASRYTDYDNSAQNGSSYVQGVKDKPMYEWLKHTYFLTPRSTVFLEKLTGFQIVKKLPTFYGIRRFITALTSARHLSLF